MALGSSCLAASLLEDEALARDYASHFSCSVRTLALAPVDKARMSALLAAVQGYVFASRRRLKQVIPFPCDGGLRAVLLCPEKCPPPPSVGDDAAGEVSFSALPHALQQILLGEEQRGAVGRRVRQSGGGEVAGSAEPPASHPVKVRVCTTTVELTVENYTMSEILEHVLRLPSSRVWPRVGWPSPVTVSHPVRAEVALPSGFETVGHIAHLNLHASLLPYKRFIGQVLLDCNAPLIRTVVNKVGALASEFRELPLELIAGEPNYVAEVKQGGYSFLVPYDRVYWNSKLSEEHDRLIQKLMPGDELLDVMAGVGPFVVPAVFARAGLSYVAGNDLNPACTSAMIENVRRNRAIVTTRGAAKGGKKPSRRQATGSDHATTTTSPPQESPGPLPPCAPFEAFNLDGRRFIEEMRRTRIVRPRRLPGVAEPDAGGLGVEPLPSKRRRHFAMNLPALAVTFLNAFSGPQWLDTDAVVHDRAVVVHCYCFVQFSVAALAGSSVSNAKSGSATAVAAGGLEEEEEGDDADQLLRSAISRVGQPGANPPSADWLKRVALAQAELVLGHQLSETKHVEEVHIVRDVAPHKVMCCVSFTLPDSIFDGCATQPPLGDFDPASSGRARNDKRRRSPE